MSSRLVCQQQADRATTHINLVCHNSPLGDGLVHVQVHHHQEAMSWQPHINEAILVQLHGIIYEG